MASGSVKAVMAARPLDYAGASTLEPFPGAWRCSAGALADDLPRHIHYFRGCSSVEGHAARIVQTGAGCRAAVTAKSIGSVACRY